MADGSRNPGTLAFDDLRALTGYERAADIEKCLQRNRIPYFYGRAGVWTTLALVNAAGGLRTEAPEGDYAHLVP